MSYLCALTTPPEAGRAGLIGGVFLVFVFDPLQHGPWSSILANIPGGGKRGGEVAPGEGLQQRKNKKDSLERISRESVVVR